MSILYKLWLPEDDLSRQSHQIKRAANISICFEPQGYKYSTCLAAVLSDWAHLFLGHAALLTQFRARTCLLTPHFPYPFTRVHTFFNLFLGTHTTTRSGVPSERQIARSCPDKGKGEVKSGKLKRATLRMKTFSYSFSIHGCRLCNHLYAPRSSQRRLASSVPLTVTESG